MIRSLPLIVLSLLFLISFGSASLEIDRYERQAAFGNQFVVDIHVVQISNTGKTPEEAWQWCTMANLAPHLAIITASSKADTPDRPMYLSRKPSAVVGTPAGITCYTLPLAAKGHNLAAGDTELITVSAVYSKAQIPFPATVRQGDPQRVKFSSALYALSPYKVAAQASKFDFTGCELISYTKTSGVRRRKEVLEYSAPENAEPFHIELLHFHYVNNAPFAVGTSVEKKIDVGRWGTLHMDERYQMMHGGSKLVGPWSRHLYVSNPLKFAQASFRELPAEVPPRASHIYFRDVIGNVSTSFVRVSGNSRGIAALLPRTPLFGGWSTDFEFGFKLPLGPFQKRLPDGRTELRLMAGPQVKAITIDDYVVKVELPEGATDVTVDSEIDMDVTQEPKYTYMNPSGRTVVLIRLTNMLDALNVPLFVRYKLPPFAWAREPALWTASLAALLAAVVWFWQADFSLVKQDPVNERKRLPKVETPTTGFS